MVRRRHRNRTEHPLNRPENERIGPVEARWRGERGAKGDKGERGLTGGLSAKVQRALLFLFLLPSLIAVIAVYGVIRQDQASSRVRCESLAQVVSIPVPVPVTDNPSREWVARYSQIQRQRGEQLGCRLPPPRFVHVKGS